MVDDALARRARSTLPRWSLEGEAIVARWSFPDFASALSAAVRVGALAERADHHPEMLVRWGALEVRLTTHKAGTLTERDLDLAAAIEADLGRPAD